MINKLRKAFAVFMLMFCSFFGSAEGLIRVNAEEKQYDKVINVLYDDSGSMYWDGRNRWCVAKYALEVFGAMLGENDQMNIYMLNGTDIITVDGKDSKRVDTIHHMNSVYNNTLVGNLKKAGNALKKVSNAEEKWLVMLTDGDFEDASVSEVQSFVDGCNAEGIKTVFLGIGGATVLNNDPSKYAFASKVEDTTNDILAKVTSAANQIFEHQILPPERISGSGPNFTLDIDIPVEQIIVFAQGEGAKVGSIEYNGSAIKPSEMFTVRHSGDVLPIAFDERNQYMVKADESLHGVVAEFNAAEGFFEKGMFTVDVRNTTLVEYYYKPAVNVNCELYLNNQLIPPNSTGLESGSYKVKMNFSHPKTGEIISSPLLDAAEFSLNARNNDDVYVIDGTSGDVTLKKGSVVIHATAKFPDNVELHSEKRYNVQQSLKVSLIGDPPEYSQEDLLRSDAQGIRIKITDADDGGSITSDVLDKMQFSVYDGTSDNSGITWSWKKNDDGTWTGVPKSTDGSMSSLKTGKRDLTVTAQYEDGENSGTGMVTVPVDVREYQGSPLYIHIDPNAEYDLNNYLKGEYMTVEVTYPDPLTGEEKIISEEMWNDLSLEKTLTRKNGKKPHLAIKLEKGETPGTYRFKPECWPFRFTSIFTSSDDHSLNLSGTVKSGEFTYSGESEEIIHIIPLKWQNVMLRIGILLAILVLILGYIIKPKIKTHGRNFYPCCQIYRRGVGENGISARKKVKWKFPNVIIPFKRGRGYVFTADTNYGCPVGNLYIEAVSNNSFRILNNNLPLHRMRISGTIISTNEELHARQFVYQAFSLESYDDHGMKTGTFQFYKPDPL